MLILWKIKDVKENRHTILLVVNFEKQLYSGNQSDKKDKAKFLLQYFYGCVISIFIYFM